MSLRKAAVLDLATAAYEINAEVKRGVVERVNGHWTIAGMELEKLLAQYEGQELVMILASLNDNRALDARTCTRCGREFVGLECPSCREARMRLRGY
jgi:hypothetical protein